jgi:HAMP domain-containing protein
MFDDNTSPITALRTALDDVDCIDPSTLSDPELEAAFAQMERAAQRLEAQRGRLLAEIDRRKSFRRSGHLSTTAWLVDRFRASGAAAAQQVRVARALEEMPRVREALSAGEVSTSAARVLVDAREEHRQAFDQAEPLLVQAARSLPVRQLSSAVSRWSEQVDAGAAEERARRLR